ncbi:MAG: tRNA (adenosine(37)-N6)-threonylcarbamoyltransferase complex ATPase subunit type 1 TsaE [Mariprofundus sp.]
MNYQSHNESETIEFAAGFAATLKPGDVVAVSGDLGAGKSVFCRAVLRALGVTDEALPSPTFAIIQEYDADHCRVAHMDWYRLDDAAEIDMLGVRDFFISPWVCLIEWPERADEVLPETTIRVQIQCDNDHMAWRWIEVQRFAK